MEQRLRFQLDPHRRIGRAAHVPTSPTPVAPASSDCCRTVAGGVVQLAGGQRFRREREDHDRRVGGIDLAIGRIRCAGVAGRSARAALIAACTSRAAPSMLRFEVELQRDARRAEPNSSRSSR